MPCWWFRKAYADRLLRLKKKKVNIIFMNLFIDIIWMVLECIKDVGYINMTFSTFDMHKLKVYVF